jgi:hypothetical protein
MMAEESPEISTAHALRGAVESSSEYVEETIEELASSAADVGRLQAPGWSCVRISRFFHRTP